MAKDPAVLFYYQDFLVGTQFMSDSDIGKFIRILCHQADKGNLSKEQVLNICKSSDIPKMIKEKLMVDENGNYYNERMRVEKEKRRNFTESRKKNRLGKKDMNNTSLTYDTHMENENENTGTTNNNRKNFFGIYPPLEKL